MTAKESLAGAEMNGEKKETIEDSRIINIGTLSDDDELDTTKDGDKSYKNLLKLKQEMLETKKSKHAWRIFNCSRLVEKQKTERKLLVFVIFLFLVIVTGLVVIYHFHEEELYYVYNGPNLLVNEKTLSFEMTNHKKAAVAGGTLWRSRPKDRLPFDCSESSSDDLCLLWKKTLQLNVSSKYVSNDTRCYEFTWSSQSSPEEQQDCFDLGDAQWFGGGLVEGSDWPLQKLSFSRQKFLSGKSSHDSLFGPVIEKYWLNSNGVAIVVSENSSLEISINQKISDTENETDHQFCLYASADHSSKQKYSDLMYTVCVAPNILEAHRIALPLVLSSSNLTKRDIGEDVLRVPFWSTWSNLKTDYNQDDLLAFANTIEQHGYDHKVLLIDDGWESHYGDVLFDKNKFPDPLFMVNTLRERGFQLSLIVRPQVSTDSLSFNQAALNDYLVKDSRGQVPGLTRWSVENDVGIAGIIDVSEEASSWNKQRLNEIRKKYGIDFFHFSGGEISSLPSNPTFNHSMSDPNDYTKLHAQIAFTFGHLVFVEAAYKAQHYSTPIRITNKKSTWSRVDGLGSVIPTVLNLGMVGYQLFLPEAAGGCSQPEIPSKELMIRWLQLNIFMPFTHLSVTISQFDNETQSYARELINLRQSIVVPEILRTYEESSPTEPIVRPIWWLSPSDEQALQCTSEFLIGDRLLVAPILEEGSEHRDIYFPEGLWEDKENDRVFVGPKLMVNYHVPLYKVAYFFKK